MLLSVVVVAVAFPIVAGLVGLSGEGAAIGAADVADFIERRQSYNLEGGGAVEISQLSLPGQLFTYLFRPLPHESVSLASLFASIDNVIIFLILGYGVMQSVRRKALFRIPNSYVLWMYSLGSWLALAITTANLGIAVRQKWMFLPCLLCLAFSVYFQGRSSASRKVLSRRDLAI